MAQNRPEEARHARQEAALRALGMAEPSHASRGALLLREGNAKEALALLCLRAAEAREAMPEAQWQGQKNRDSADSLRFCVHVPLYSEQNRASMAEW
jgi:hypothetical protein